MTFKLKPKLQYKYRFGGTVLNCDRAVDGLETASDGSSDYWSVKFNLDERKSKPGEELIEVWKDANDVLCVLQKGGEYIVRFERLADFSINPGARSIEAYSSAECSVETVNHLLLDQVLPRAMAHCGGMILHAAGVLVENHAVAFLGETGHGKSTLANSYMQAGHALLTDDALLINEETSVSMARALYPCIRLWPETLDGLYDETPQTAPMAHYSTKQRMLFGTDSRVTTEPHPLSAAFILNGIEGNGPALVTRLGQQAACIELIKNSFQLDPADPIIATSLFEQAVALAASVPIYQLMFPRGFEHIAQTMDIIAQQLEDLAS